ALSGGQYGVYAVGEAGGGQLWITSNTIVPSVTVANNTWGLYLNGLTTGATVENNTVAYRTPGSMGGFTSTALEADYSTGLQIDHNRLDQPGSLTGGS